MRAYVKFEVEDTDRFKKQIIAFAQNTNDVAILDSCNHLNQSVQNQKYGTYDFLAGFEAFRVFKGGISQLQCASELKDWVFGNLSYDLKNELEALYSVNNDALHFDNVSFFQPRYVLAQKGEQWFVYYLKGENSEVDALSLIEEIKDTAISSSHESYRPIIQERVSKQEYLHAVTQILEHIHKGDIYELNYCVEFFAEQFAMNPNEVYQQLIQISPTPFAGFFRMNDKYILCASPERYLTKLDRKLITQPIKGTAKRSEIEEEDLLNQQNLQNSIKEKAENVMIVDLVRNDLSRVAEQGSVCVEELCGIYPFRQVHQMISTVTAQLSPDKTSLDAIKASFPMGSMTGAPKLRAMKLIEKYEASKRGAYSGAIGYFTPDGDFDFNVVIRSILYNSSQQYLSFMVGSAITAQCKPEQEYDECFLKAKAILEVLGHQH